MSGFPSPGSLAKVRVADRKPSPASSPARVRQGEPRRRRRGSLDSERPAPILRRAARAVLAAAAAGALVAAPAVQQAARAHDFWINWGGYKSPDGVHCCGPNDCEEVPAAAVAIGPGGYAVRFTSRGGQAVDETVPFAEALPSEDGRYWRCRRYDGTRRCFFAPQPGS